MRNSFALIVAAATLAFPALAQEGTKLGVLDCSIEGGAGFIVGSSKELSCTFSPTGGAGPTEAYAGVVNKIGLDVGVTGVQIMQWLVLAPSAEAYQAGALAGSYVGATAEATVAIGAGANLLVGGSNKTFTLQPLSVSGQSGVNLAIGVSEFRLAPAG